MPITYGIEESRSRHTAGRKEEAEESENKATTKEATLEAGASAWKPRRADADNRG
jgi:hypothetical protein